MDTVSNGLSHKGENQKSKTVSPFITACSGFSRMGQVHHRHTQPMWYSPQQTLMLGTSTAHRHTQPMWYSPHRTLTHGTSTSHRHTHPKWYSSHRTLTHGTSTAQTHTAHVVQSAANSRAWDKYITDTHIPCGTVRIRLSRMGRVQHRHTHPMWYSPHQTLTDGTSTSQTHTAHVVQSAANSHTWDEYSTDTHSLCGTVRIGLSRMGQVHHRHTQPMWYSPQRTLTHGTSTAQTHTVHVVESASDSHAWDEYSTDTHSPCGTVRSELSHKEENQKSTTVSPCGYSPQRTLTQGRKPKE